MTVRISKLNESYLRIDTDQGILMEMSRHFSFMVSGYQFMPKYRMGIWDGRIRLLNTGNQTIYAGLYEDIVKFCQNEKYDITLSSDFKQNDFSKVEAEKLVKEWNVKYVPRDYQLKAFIDAIRLKRATFLSPTASGKSFIIFLIYKYFSDKKTLLIVPNINLVNQMKSDFMEYDLNGEVKKNIQLIMGGKEKIISKPLVISTWQSIYKQPKKYFEQFDVVIVDEAHGAKANEMVKIMERCTKAQYRYGFTGTLDGSLANEMVIKGLFGPLRIVTTTKKLMDRGDVATLKIKSIVLNYKDETKKVIVKGKYPDELKWLFSNKKRNKFIENLALSLEGNTMIIFSRVGSHLVPFFEELQKKAKVPVYMVHGGVDGDEREEIRKIVNTHKSSITIASMRTFSKGVNIPNLNNLIFASPSKAIIDILQSIGRILRLGENKTSCTAYDIADDLSYKKWKNYAFKHYIERLKIYESQKFDYKQYQVMLEK